MPSDPFHALKQVSVRDFRENLSRYLKMAHRGERFVVTSHGEPVAQFGPPSAVGKQARPFGILRGRIRMAPDFDDTPDDVIAAMEGEESQGPAR